MSGPKYTNYEVERQHLLIIKAQLEADIERGKCAQLNTSINECIENSNSFIAKIDVDKYDNVIIAAKKFFSDNDTLKELKKFVDELKHEISQNYAITGDSKSLANILYSYENRIQKIRNLVKVIETMSKELNEKYNERVQEERAMEFENTKWDSYTPISSVSQSLMNTYLNIINQLIECGDFEKEKAKYDDLLNNHSFDDQFKISQMKMKFDAYLVEKQADTHNEEILGLRSMYISLANLIYGQCTEVPEDADTLSIEITEMLEYMETQRVGEYVATSVDKVMQELGYKMLNSEVLDTQKITKQHYDYSTNSAITVASSENGALMLEVVGKKNELGEAGSVNAVQSDMERFCPDYQKVKQGLEKYGIKLREKKLYPPEAKYVRFVDVKKASSSDRRITARSRKKTMYNE